LPVEFEFEMYGERGIRMPHFTGHLVGFMFSGPHRSAMR